MSVKVAKALREKLSASGVSSAIREYERRFKTHKRGGAEAKESEHRQVNNLYYDLVTDFFEYDWGRSFHFAPHVPGESFRDSLVRHERYIAHMLELSPGMVGAGLGCGVGRFARSRLSMRAPNQASSSTRRPTSLRRPA